MAARNKVKVVDADGHVVEPMRIWTELVEAKYHELVPRLVKDDTGRERMMIEGKMRAPGPFSLGAALTPGGLANPEWREKRTYADAQPGGWDPHARIKDMDADGIDVAVLYPTVGLFFGGLQNDGLAIALCRAYNDWLAEYCKPYPDRLIGIAVVPMQDVDEAVKETRRAVEKLGMKGVMIRPNPYKGRTWDDPAYDPFWAEVQSLRVPVGVHEGTTGDMPTAGADRCKNFFFMHIISHPHEQQIACMQIVCGGVLERFPKLQVAFLESGGGWLPHWLERFDSHYDKLGFLVPHLKRKPSEYFQRQCYISFDPDEKTLAATVELVGEDNVVWASDYPHFDALCPGVVEELREQAEHLTKSAMRKVMGENAVRLYHL
jgi:predicted TIM-barrel fold metal-dependent hydrolase